MKFNAISLFSSGLVCFGLSLLYIHFKKEKKKTCKCTNRVKSKVVAITGANSGIGFEVALSLATDGAIVYLLCRNLIKGRKAAREIIQRSKNHQVYFVELDLCSFKSCNDCVAALLYAEPKLDILIHNAAIFHHEPRLSEDGFEIHEQTNFLDLPFIIASVDPGNVWTPIYRNCWRSVSEIIKRIECWLLMSSPKEGAQSVIHAARVSQLPSGALISDCDVVSVELEEVDFQRRKKFIEGVFRLLGFD